MKKLLFILFFLLTSLGCIAQDITPADTAYHNLPTYSFRYYTKDSSVWIYKGAKYKTTKLVSNKRLKFLVDSINAKGYKQKIDSIKASGYMTNQKFVDANFQGFLNQTETNISFSDSTFTLSKVGDSWSYYYNGRKHTILTDKTIKLTSPISTSLIYISINDTTGNLSVSTSPWTLAEVGTSVKIPVATLAWNNALTPKYILSEERHTVQIQRNLHRYEHLSEGTKIVVQPVLSNYNIAPANPTDASNAIHIAETKIADEDIFITLAALTSPNGSTTDFYNLYKSGGVWVWQASAVPLKYTTTGYIEYDLNGTMTAGNKEKYYNTYLYVSNIIGDQRYFILSGKGGYTLPANAYGESFQSFDLAGIPTNEGLGVYQITWKTNENYNTKGKVVIDRIQRITSSVVSTSVQTTGIHNTMAGLQVDRGTEFWHLSTTQKDSVISAEQHADTIRNQGHATIFDLLSKRNLNNHDSLSTLDERKYQSLTDTLTWGLGLNQMGHVVKVDTASASIISRERTAKYYEPKITAGVSAQYWRGDKTWQTLPTQITLLNDQWITSYDYSGNAVNLLKISKDNVLTFAPKVGIQSLMMVADAGKVNIADMPNIRSASGDTLQYNFNIGNVSMLKMRGIANGSGGLSDTTIIIPKLRLTRNAVNGYYLKVVDAYGTVKPSPITATYQGTWNATTNTPTLANGTGTAGFWYRCVTAGTTNFGAGNITFAIGDDAYYSGTIWQKVPGVSYTLQAATPTVLGGIKNGNGITMTGDVASVKTDYVENAAHTGDATGATALTLATVNTAGTYNYGVFDAKGRMTSGTLYNYRLMQNHDSLTNLDEKSYNSLTDKPTSFDLPNDTWTRVYDYAGNISNMWKVSKDNILTPAFRLGINSLFFTRNSGINTIADLPVDVLSATNDVHGFKLNIGGVQALKISGKWTGTAMDTIKVTAPVFEMTTGAAINKIAMSEDSRGKIKWSDTKYLFSLTANRILYASATNEMGQLAAGTDGKIMFGETGGAPKWSTVGYPNGAQTARKIIVSNGTDWVASTELWPVATTNGNILRANGTDWTSVTIASAGISTDIHSNISALNSVTSANGTNTGDNAVNSNYSGLVTMTYPGAGIPLSTGSAWGTSITNNASNWNTAYGWGNHASAGYATGTIYDATLTADVSGGGLSISAAPTFTANASSNKTITITSNATATNTASTIVLRDASGNVSLTGDICTTSDIRLKKNIKKIDWSKLSKLDRIDWIQYAKKTESDSVIRYGVSAQELQKILPQFVYTAQDTAKTLSVDYNSLLIVKILEMEERYQAIIKGLERRIEKLENHNKWEAKQINLQ